MYDVYLQLTNNEIRNYRKVSTMSFSSGRVIITFSDGSMVRYSPREIRELKTVYNKEVNHAE